jgi:tetratricopeptide (TPR) repeat protein
MPAAWLLLAWAVPAPDRRAALLSWPRRLLAVAPFLAVDVRYAAGVLRSIEGSAHAGFAVAGLPPWTYFLTELRAVATYLRLLLWPSGQNFDWDFPVSRSLAEPAVLLCGLLLASLAGGAVALVLASRRLGPEAAGAARVAGFGVLFFLLVLSPTSSVVPLADALVEHRTYLAAWGVLVAVAVAGERAVAWAERLGARRAAFGGAVVLAAVWAALAVALHRRNAVWETQLALWSDTVAKSPAKAGPHLNLGYALRVAERHDEAIAEYRKALLCAPDEARAVEIVRNLSAALIFQGRNDEAIATLEQALPQAPQDSGLLTNLAVAWGAKGTPALARFYANAAVVANPDQGHAWNLLGYLALGDGDLPAARDALERAVALDPDVGIRHYNLGTVFERQRDLPSACAEWGRALEARLEVSKRAEIERIMQGRCAR